MYTAVVVPGDRVGEGLGQGLPSVASPSTAKHALLVCSGREWHHLAGHKAHRDWQQQQLKQHPRVAAWTRRIPSSKTASFDQVCGRWDYVGRRLDRLLTFWGGCWA